MFSGVPHGLIEVVNNFQPLILQVHTFVEWALIEFGAVKSSTAIIALVCTRGSILPGRTLKKCRPSGSTRWESAKVSTSPISYGFRGELPWGSAGCFHLVQVGKRAANNSRSQIVRSASSCFTLNFIFGLPKGVAGGSTHLLSTESCGRAHLPARIPSRILLLFKKCDATIPKGASAFLLSGTYSTE